VDGQNASVVLAEDSVIDITGRLIHIIVKELDAEQQSLFLENSFHLFVDHKPSNIILENSDLVSEKFHPLEKDASEQFAGCTIVFACILAAVRRELALPLQNFTTFLRDSLELAEAPKSATHRLALLRIIGLIVNKWVKSSADNDQVKEVTETLLNSINSSDGMAEVLNERLRIVFWITKALLMRTDKYGMEVVQKLVNLLDNPRFGQTVSRGFSVLLGEDELLNKENHAVVRMLFKQRTFMLCVPNIIKGFEVARAGMPLTPQYWLLLTKVKSHETELPHRSLQNPSQRPGFCYHPRTASSPPPPSPIHRPA
jgi:DNA repair/transcription protein MET18/MMS19